MIKKIEFSKKFIKHFRKRIRPYKNIRSKFEKRLQLFQNDRNLPLLRDHQLRGKKNDKRSFSITGDIRIVYKEYGSYILFLDIGAHNQVYYN